MSFLAPLLAALAAFAAIPPILHLIRRRRIRILDFPTFRFLKEAALEQRMRLRFQDQLLMILRMLVLLLLAAAFMGPLTDRDVPEDRATLGKKNLLVIDDTLSMSASSGSAEKEETLYEVAARTARGIIARSPADWKVVFASELVDTTLENTPSLDHDRSLEEGLELHPTPTLRESLGPLLERTRERLADEETALWVLTDGALANWEVGEASSSSREKTEERIEVLLLDPDRTEGANWGIREVALNNQPLLPGEPALLSLGFESFGAQTGANAPDLASFSWTTEPGIVATREEPLGAETQGEARVALSNEDSIRSVSVALSFANDSDALAGDNTVLLSPIHLDPVRLTVISGNEDWRRTFEAALMDFDVAFADPENEPGPEETRSAAYAVVLDKRAPRPEWTSYLKARLRSGAGVLVCYDDEPSRGRLESWTAWWSEFDVSASAKMLTPGDRTVRVGSPPWFGEALDAGARAVDWADGAFEIVALNGCRSEWLLGDEAGGFSPVFQTRGVGQGVLASWNVPLSLERTELILRPGWVPLLSQAIKRTLIHPETFAPSGEDRSLLVESDLARLADEDQAALSEKGWRFSSAAAVLDDIENLPSKRHDWTALLLGLCLVLALVELGVGNHA